MPRGRKPKDEDSVDEETDYEKFTASKLQSLKNITARYLLLLQREAMRWKEG